MFERVAKSAAKLRFPTGAIGKTCMMLAIVAISCAGLAWAARNPWVAGLGLIIVAVVTIYTVKRIFDFADKNPTAAILEGSEFVQHEQITLAAKGTPQLPSSEVIQINEPEDIPLLEDASLANQPDQPDPPKQEDGQ